MIFGYLICIRFYSLKFWRCFRCFLVPDFCWTEKFSASIDRSRCRSFATLASVTLALMKAEGVEVMVRCDDLMVCSCLDEGSSTPMRSIYKHTLKIRLKFSKILVLGFNLTIKIRKAIICSILEIWLNNPCFMGVFVGSVSQCDEEIHDFWGCPGIGWEPTGKSRTSLHFAGVHLKQQALGIFSPFFKTCAFKKRHEKKWHQTFKTYWMLSWHQLFWVGVEGDDLPT